MAEKQDEKKENGENSTLFQQLEKQRAITQKCKNLEKHSAEYRRKFDWEWMVRVLYARGYQFARYNRGTGTIVFTTRTGVRIPINLVQAHLRGVRNQVTSFQPKWEVLPSLTTESSIENARYSGKVLDHVYRQAQIKRKIKEAINDALLKSIAIWRFDTDRKKDIVISSVDPFDFFVDPNVKSPNLNDPEFGAEYVILTHQLPLEAVKTNKHYKNTADLQSDNLTSSAEYKRFLLQVTKHRTEFSAEENQTIMLKEAWLRERQENGSFKIRIVTYVDSLDIPLRDDLTDEEEYPFEIYQGDIANGELYAESWVKHLIPINRVINALESHIFEYNHFYAKGRFVMDKNSGARIIVNQHGQIIEKNRGSEITSLRIEPLPATPENQVERMRRNFEDLSGVHDVSLGRLPGTIRSGVAVAELRQADSTNQNDLVDNLEDFLSRSGRKILKLVAENWTTGKLISVTGLGGRAERFIAAGERSNIAKRVREKKLKTYTFGEMELPLAIIGADNEVRVQVGSWLAYTKEARQEKLKELFRLGAIDQRTYLEHSEFADIDSIIERTRDEALLQSRLGTPSTSVGKNYGIELDDESLALAENELMLEGRDVPVEPDDDHEVHLAIHKEYQDDDIVRAHINEHIKWMRWQAQMSARPEDQGAMLPQGPAEEVQPFVMGPQIGPGAPPLKPFEQAVQPGGFTVPPNLAEVSGGF